jgi:hypothetical protein
MVATSAIAWAAATSACRNLPRLDVKQVEGADHGASQSHGQGVHRVEAGGERFGREAGPAAVDRGQVLVHHRLAGAVAVEAGAFLGLQFEQFQHPHGLAGGGHHPEVAFWCGQHEAGCSDIEHVDATVGKQGQ